jgi:hypothetical protein
MPSRKGWTCVFPCGCGEEWKMEFILSGDQSNFGVDLSHKEGARSSFLVYLITRKEEEVVAGILKAIDVIMVNTSVDCGFILGEKVVRK